MPAIAQASDQQHYDIPAGPLTAALKRFGQEAGILLSFSTELTSGRRASPVQGRFTVERGLQTLLAGSGLQAVATSGGGFTLQPVTADGAVNLPSMTIEGATDETYLPRYVTRRASVGAKGDLPLRDVPQAVTVVSEEMLRDLAPQSLDEVADYIAGVDREAVQANPYAISFFVRGFNTGGSASAYNGFREYGFNTPQAAINIDRIEFLKGPAAVVSGGNGALSGLVNIVSKRPLHQPFNRLEATVGSFGHLVTSLDSTGPLDEAGTLRYRLTASVDKDGNFLDDAEQESRFISPYLSWDIGERTALDVELVNQEVERPGREAYFLRHPDFFRIPVETQLGDPRAPAGAGGELTRRLARVELTHRFENDWTVRQALFYSRVDSDDTTIQPTGYDPQTRLLSRRVRAVDEYQRDRASQTELAGTSVVGGLTHKWLAGAEIGRQSTGYIFNVAPYTAVDIFEPTSPGTLLGPLVVPFPGEDSDMNTESLYLQDLITLGGGFKLMLGLRHDWLETASRARMAGAPTERVKESETSPRAGLLYQPSEAVSYYASWGHSFRPTTGRSVTGATFAPEQGEQYELGVKVELARGLAATGAVFEYTRENILTTDPLNPDFSIAVGEQRVRGVELEALGEILPDWSIIASATLLDAEVTKDNRLPIGDRRQGVPRTTASLFNRVGLRALGLPAWSATAGISYASERESGLPNDPPGPLTAGDVRLPSYTRVDAGLIYRGTQFEFRLTGRNLTDEEIYDGYNSTFEPRAPRSYEVSLAVEF